MFEQINEPIEVIAHFVSGQMKPFRFAWQGRSISVQKINLHYTNREGRTKFYYFAVSDGVNYFKLQFDAESLAWTLLETYVE